MTKREGAIISAYTGVLIGDFEDMHKYLDGKFPGITTAGLAFLPKEDLKTATKEDFLSIEVKDNDS